VIVTADGVSPVTETLKLTFADVTGVTVWETALDDPEAAAAVPTVPPAVPIPRTRTIPVPIAQRVPRRSLIGFSPVSSAIAASHPAPAEPGQAYAQEGNWVPSQIWL
jgi:hypothetical protein